MLPNSSELAFRVDPEKLGDEVLGIWEEEPVEGVKGIVLDPASHAPLIYEEYKYRLFLEENEIARGEQEYSMAASGTAPMTLGSKGDFVIHCLPEKNYRLILLLSQGFIEVKNLHVDAGQVTELGKLIPKKWSTLSGRVLGINENSKVFVKIWDKNVRGCARELQYSYYAPDSFKPPFFHISAESGLFHANLYPGSFLIKASSKGAVSEFRDITVKVNESYENVDFVLKKGLKVVLMFNIDSVLLGSELEKIISLEVYNSSNILLDEFSSYWGYIIPGEANLKKEVYTHPGCYSICLRSNEDRKKEFTFIVEEGEPNQTFSFHLDEF